MPAAVIEQLAGDLHQRAARTPTHERPLGCLKFDEQATQHKDKIFILIIINLE